MNVCLGSILICVSVFVLVPCWFYKYSSVIEPEISYADASSSIHFA